MREYGDNRLSRVEGGFATYFELVFDQFSFKDFVRIEFGQGRHDGWMSRNIRDSP